MATNIVPFNSPDVPAHIKARAVNNAGFMAGLPKGGFPMLGTNGTRFVVKKDGVKTTIPQIEIAVVLLAAKEHLDHNYYAGVYDPNSTEEKAPDCFSRDGVRPDPSCPLKQAESCAGCPQNQFGSGTAADGTPSKGKACREGKMLAVFANKGVYGFRITPSSLKNFRAYANEATRHGVDLTTVMTIVGFDPNITYPVLTFQPGGYLSADQIAKCDEMRQSQEVADIIGGAVSGVVVAPAQMKEEVKAAPPAPPANPFDEDFGTKDTPAEKPKQTRQRTKKAEAAPAVQDPEIVEDDELAALADSLGIDL